MTDLGTRAAHDHRQGFADLDAEVVIDSLPVTGELPSWLRGTLVRNGPGRWGLGDGLTVRHWFDGLAMLHRFTIADGSVSYANRYLDTPQHRHVRATGQVGYREFATDPCRSLFRRIVSAFAPGEPGTNASVSVLRDAEDRFLALTETPMMLEFDLDSLGTSGLVGFEDDLDLSWQSAHPQLDVASGGVLNHATRFGARSSYAVYRVAAGTRRRELIATIAARRPAYMHSFGQTERYVVLAESPLTVDPLALVLSGRSYAEELTWNPDQPTRFHVIDKATGEVAFVQETEAFFSFHHVNAFEQDGEVVVDLVAYPDDAIVSRFYLDLLRDDTVPSVGATVGELRRYRLAPGVGAATAQVLSPEGIELPRIDDDAAGRPYDRVWGVGQRAGWTDQLVRIDPRTGGSLVWHEEGCFPGEPVIVSAPRHRDDAAGRDGAGATHDVASVVLSVVLDAARGRSFLLVLDPDTAVEIARAELPHHVPFGFHGAFFPGAGTTS